MKTIALKDIFRQYRKRILFTWMLAACESGIVLLFPLFMGFAIDDLLQKNYTGILYLVCFGITALLMGAGRRFYDTRLYSKIYVEVTPDLVAFEREKESSTSVITARTNLATELVEFLENSLPEIIESVIGLAGTFVIIFFLSIEVFWGCLVSSFLIVLVYIFSSDRILYFNKEFNDLYEKNVDVLEKNHRPGIISHFQGLMKWNIKLSDLETMNYSLIWVFLISLMIYSIVVVVQNGANSYGMVFSNLSYVMHFIESVIILPLFYQQFVRLKEISQRVFFS
ncbi:MAG: hypothetical protein GY754_10590 [bacterium]|nr:hypothetical protein [bacterium]